MSVTLSEQQWFEVGRRLLISWGATETIAACVARSLVDSDLAGISSHGVVRLPMYHGFVKAGWLKPANQPEVIKEFPSTAMIDGHWGFGQPAAQQATRLAMQKAQAHGIAAVGILNAGHIGRLGEYAELAAREGLIAIVMASGGATGGLMAPYGGAERVFSTNPIGASVPAQNHAPFVMDYATSIVAAGKVELAPDQDAPIPEGWVVDAEGRPATIARQLVEGGALLPFGGHKGYALALLIELMCGALTGAGCTERPDRVVSHGLGGNAAFAIAINPAQFTDSDQFYASVDGLFDRLKRVKPAAGFDQVMIPGEPEAAQRLKRQQTGISIADATWDKIAAVAAQYQVKLNDLVPPAQASH
jgi:LDH2 family malate/lactate/ureidoglycolate dehydrogenase